MDQHCDPEVLALAALGEPLNDHTLSSHIASCPLCQREIDELRSTVSVARSALGERELHAPPAHVWQSVRGELGLSADLQPAAPAGGLAGDRSSLDDAPIAAPVNLTAVRERRAGIRRFIAPVVASAAAAALVAAMVVSWSVGSPRDQGVTVASAQLDALPAWSGSTGDAIITERADGDRVIRVSLDAAVDDSVVREVWLLTQNVDGLISVGLLNGSSGEFVIPRSVDLERYSIVDISAEPLDGDPTHSGDSIVRGALDI